jgi:hypothetical protein
MAQPPTHDVQLLDRALIPARTRFSENDLIRYCLDLLDYAKAEYAVGAADPYYAAYHEYFIAILCDDTLTINQRIKRLDRASDTCYIDEVPAA